MGSVQVWNPNLEAFKNVIWTITDKHTFGVLRFQFYFINSNEQPASCNNSLYGMAIFPSPVWFQNLQNIISKLKKNEAMN